MPKTAQSAAPGFARPGAGRAGLAGNLLPKMFESARRSPTPGRPRVVSLPRSGSDPTPIDEVSPGRAAARVPPLLLEAERERSPAREIHRMHRKVLLVDDDSYSTTQLKKLLETEELSVEAVASGQEALSALGSADYSVLITDLRMPGMGGMDLIREVALRRVLVTTIVTTSFGSIERVVEAMRLGAYDFLTKPIDPTQLKIVMDRALTKRALAGRGPPAPPATQGELQLP